MATSKKSSSFRGKVGEDARRQKRDESSFGYLQLPKDVKVFQPELDSRVKLDFIPYKITDQKHLDRNSEQNIAMPGTLWYKHPYFMHRGIGAGDGNSVVCLQTIGKKCPICEHRAKLVKDGADKADIDALKSSKRNLYAVVPLDSKKFNPVIHIMDISQYLFQKLLNKELEEDSNNEIFPDIEEGMTLKVRFDSTVIGDSKPFPTASRIDFLERDATYTEDILDKVPNLDEILKILPYKELEDLFLEVSDEDDGGKLKEDAEPEKEEVKEIKRVPKTTKSEEETKVALTLEDINVMSERRLTKVIEEEGLKTDPSEFEDNVEGLKTAIAEELGISVPAKAPARSVKRTTGPAKDPNERCPHGHIFAKDFEGFDECPDCVLWDDCYDANKKLRK